MGTRSSITIIKKEKGKVVYEGVYCHWDGYTSHNGAILLGHYTTQEEVERLISLGDLSILGEKVDPQEDVEHTFDKPQEGVCVFYNRDRGEKWEYTKPKKEETEEKYYEMMKLEYNYLFKDGRWYWNYGYGEDWRDGKGTWKELTQEDCSM